MILVTGGAGFIGSHLVRQLVERGDAVRVLERPGASVDHLPLDRIEVVRADIRDHAAVRTLVRGCARVYHLAADPNLWRRDRDGFDAINHVGAAHLMRAALDAGAERVLFVSTESILTCRNFSGGAVETVRFREQDMLGPYCLSKFRGERVAFELADAGAPVIVCSPTLPIGPGDLGQTPPTRLAVAFCQGRVPAVVDCRLNLIDVRDAADGLVRAMERGRTGIRYLLGAHNTRLVEWLSLLAGLVGRPAPRWQVPYPIALATGWFSERWADLVSHRMPMATVTGVRLTRRSMHFDASTSLRELGLRPRGVEASIADAVAWYRAKGWIPGGTAGNRRSYPRARPPYDRFMPRGLLLVLSGPSGVGKTTIAHELLCRFGGHFSVSCTTRQPSSGEREGVDYRFVSEEAFQRMVREDAFLEHAMVFGRSWYGSPRAPVEEALARGELVVLDIDVQGAEVVHARVTDMLGIFILPPSEAALLERLRRRGREDESAIQRRFAESVREMGRARTNGVYDAFIVNDDLPGAIEQVVELVRARLGRLQAAP